MYILHGGSWYGDSQDVLSAWRNRNIPTKLSSIYSFRLIIKE